LREKIKFQGSSLYFWRTKNRAEVDFIIKSGKEILPVEVKYKNFKKPEIKRSLRSFIEEYHPKKALVINLSLMEKSKIGKTEVIFLPFSKIMTANSYSEFFCS